MKEFFKVANLAFYFLMLLIFFVVGMYFAYLIDAGKNQGLAGGAIVFGYGVLFGSIALISSFFIVRFVKHQSIVKMNWVLLIAVCIIYGLTYLRFIERDKKDKQEQPKENPRPVTEPAINAPNLFFQGK